MEPLSLINTALSSARLAGNYSGYKSGRRKEDDLMIRRKLMSQLDTMRDHLINIMEDSDLGDRIEVQKLIDVLDTFRNEIELAETGHKYPFFSHQRGLSRGVLKSLIKYDHEMIKQLEAALEATSILEKSLVHEDSGSPSPGLRTIKEYITTSRGQFDNRVSVIKNIRKVTK